MIIFSDIDGVLTDGFYYHSEDGMIGKGFCTRDFHAINNFSQNGFNFIFLTASTDIATIKKFKYNKLKIVPNCKDKKEAVISSCIQLGYVASDCIFVGDGPQDMCAMEVCGQSFCPNDACHAVLSMPFVIRLNSNGGKGVIDEMLFKAFRKDYESIMIK
jgi:YrbI family 3-deoxy-D-manno-octulosonate 8-phosphate phosphatase